MSGGSFNYTYRVIEDIYAGKTEDKQIDELISDLSKLLKSLEWYKSGDTGKEDYWQDKKRFKDKWMRCRGIHLQDLEKDDEKFDVDFNFVMFPNGKTGYRLEYVRDDMLFTQDLGTLVVVDGNAKIIHW